MTINAQETDHTTEEPYSPPSHPAVGLQVPQLLRLPCLSQAPCGLKRCAFGTPFQMTNTQIEQQHGFAHL